MSGGHVWVRFPDGVIQHGNYQGSADTAWPMLFDTAEQASEAYRARVSLWPDPYPETRDGQVDVEIATNYGGDFWWKGTAIKGCLFTCNGLDVEHWDGLPDWIEEGTA